MYFLEEIEMSDASTQINGLGYYMSRIVTTYSARCITPTKK
jgi:hypothetical protein